MNAKKILIGLLAVTTGLFPSVEAVTTNLNKSSTKSHKNITPLKSKNLLRNISLIVGGVGITVGGVILYRKLVDYFTDLWRDILSSSVTIKSDYVEKVEKKLEMLLQGSDASNFDEAKFKYNLKLYCDSIETKEEKITALRELASVEISRGFSFDKDGIIFIFKLKKCIYEYMEELELGLDLGFEKIEKGELESLLKFVPYLSDEVISNAQKEAYDKIQIELGKNGNLRDNKCRRNYNNMHNYFNSFNPICSYRTENSESSDQLTEVEKLLDEAVDKEDLPIQTINLYGIHLLYLKSLEVETVKKGNPKFILKQGVDALNLDSFASGEGKDNDNDINIVQLASQFNGLEAMGSYFSPVKGWLGDPTQGPRASMQSIAGAKHRESAYLKGKLPDGIKRIIEDWKKWRNKGDCYKDLYKAGYLQLSKVNDEKDLESLRDYIKSQFTRVNFLCQWVKCDFSGQLQLQVFNAAPSFQGEVGIDWNSSNPQIQLKKEICEDLISMQYAALARIAAIKAKMSPEKTVNLHLTLIGQGVFNNPPSTITKALNGVNHAVKDIGNIRVFLHGYNENDIQKWEKALRDNKISAEKWN